MCLKHNIPACLAAGLWEEDVLCSMLQVVIPACIAGGIPACPYPVGFLSTTPKGEIEGDQVQAHHPRGKLRGITRPFGPPPPHCMVGCTPPRADTPQSRHPRKQTPPPKRRPLLRTGRILLECILVVLNTFWSNCVQGCGRKMFYIYLFNVRVGFLSTTSHDTLLIFHLFVQIILTTDLIVQTYLRIFSKWDGNITIFQIWPDMMGDQQLENKS